MPQHRLTPLKTHWMALYKPVTENMKLDMRMNLKTKKVSLTSRLWSICLRTVAIWLECCGPDP